MAAKKKRHVAAKKKRPMAAKKNRHVAANREGVALARGLTTSPCHRGAATCLAARVQWSWLHRNLTEQRHPNSGTTTHRLTKTETVKTGS